MRHCVLDEVGSRLRQADEAGFRCQVFADLTRGEFLSLLWPIRGAPGASEVRGSFGRVNQGMMRQICCTAEGGHCEVIFLSRAVPSNISIHLGKVLSTLAGINPETRVSHLSRTHQVPSRAIPNRVKRSLSLCKITHVLVTLLRLLLLKHITLKVTVPRRKSMELMEDGKR